MPTFPAFDDVEPPPRSRRARVLRAGVVVGVLALVAAGGLGLAGLRSGDDGTGLTAGPVPSASATSEEPRTGPPVGVVYIDSERLGIADPDGGRRAQLSQPFPTTQHRFALAVAPDRSSVVTEDGYLVDLTRPGPAQPRRVVPADLAGFSEVPADGFADGGARLALQLGAPGPPRVALLTLATGTVEPLADGLGPAGDPTGPGAAYAAGVRDIPSPVAEYGERFPAAERVERRTLGGPPVTLLTRADLLRRMRLGPNVPVAIRDLAWSPDGKHLAIAAYAATGEQVAFGAGGRHVLVVVDRDGRIVALRPYELRHLVGAVAWSPGGDQLAFQDFHEPTRLNRPTAKVYLWTITTTVGPPQEVTPPRGQQPFGHGHCLWSPDGTRLLCGDDRAWYVMALSGGTSFVAESVPARPMTWVGG